MTIVYSVLAFLGVLGVLIIVHELGHYWAARWCGVKVLRFSVGMGTVLLSRRFGPDQTEWVLSAFPLGGYVKMLDSRDQDLEMGALSQEERTREFTRQSVWKRMTIVAAGPISNFLLAIALFAGLYIHGIPEPVAKIGVISETSIAYQAGLRNGMRVTAINREPVQSWRDLRWKLLQLAVQKQPAHLDVEVVRTAELDGADHLSLETLSLPVERLSVEDLDGDFLEKLGMTVARPPVVLGAVAPEGAAAQAGLQQGDRVLTIDGVQIGDGVAFVERIRAAPGTTLEVEILRRGQRINLFLTPDSEKQGTQSVGKIKAVVSMMPEMVVVQSNLFDSLGQAVRQTWEMSTLTVRMLGKMAIGEVSLKNITGPITIADYAGQTAQIGIVSYLSFIALISISLGVMNLLPIPVLDGGLLLYYSWEILTGHSVSKRFEEMAQRVGLGILAALMAVAFFNDITRLFS